MICRPSRSETPTNLGVGDYVLAIGEPFRSRGNRHCRHRQRQGPLAAGRRLTCRSFRPTRRSTPVIPVGRCLTRAARWSASTRRSTATRAAIRGCRSPSPSIWRCRSRTRSSRPARWLHSRLGVEVQTLNQSLADSFKLKIAQRRARGQSRPDSAADQAGIKVGDVILKFNGTPIIDAGQLSQRVGAAAPGDKASLEIWRNGKTLS